MRKQNWLTCTYHTQLTVESCADKHSHTHIHGNIKYYLFLVYWLYVFPCSNLDLNCFVDMCAAFWDSYITIHNLQCTIHNGAAAFCE